MCTLPLDGFRLKKANFLTAHTSTPNGSSRSSACPHTIDQNARLGLTFRDAVNPSMALREKHPVFHAPAPLSYLGNDVYPRGFLSGTAHAVHFFFPHFEHRNRF